MQVVYIINVLLLVVAAWASVFHVIPACATSRFRHSLWELRDDLTDDLRHGYYTTGEESAKQLVKLCELGIEHGSGLSAFNIFLFNFFGTSEERKREPIFDVDAISQTDRERFGRAYARFEVATLRKMLLGTPSGWVVLIVALGRSVARRVFRGPHVGSLVADIKEQVREDSRPEVDETLAYLRVPRSSGGRRTPLHQHV